MATTTILQYLQHKGVSASGASVEYGTSPLDRIQTETFMCETAITAGQLVAVDVSKMASDPTGGFTALTVVAADFIGPVPLQKIAVGIAQSSVTGTTANPQPIVVVVRGPCRASSLATVGCSVGDPLVLDTAGAAGSLMVNTPANIGHVVCYALETVAAAGPVKVYVLGSGI
jgi:hypothetical protein